MEEEINVKKMIDELVNKGNKEDLMNYHHRMITTGDSMAYLKIAEGCSNYCTYCAIPYIQGKYISRKYEDIIEEALNDRYFNEVEVYTQRYIEWEMEKAEEMATLIKQVKAVL